jgi:hypothetical protein
MAGQGAHVYELDVGALEPAAELEDLLDPRRCFAILEDLLLDLDAPLDQPTVELAGCMGGGSEDRVEIFGPGERVLPFSPPGFLRHI